MTLQVKESRLEEIQGDLLIEKGIRLFVKRDDLIHPYVSGNKWRKLKYNVEAFLHSGKDALLTLGGAYSNHIIATAAAGKEFGIQTTGIIRGEELTADSNPVLHFARDCGMELVFVSREQYKSLHDETGLQSFLYNLKHKTLNFKHIFLLPEGGFNELAVKGCEEIIPEIEIPFDYICCAVGTGATICGIIRSLKVEQQAIGFPVLQGEGFLQKQIEEYVGDKNNWSLNFGYHFGGYAKTTDELKKFCTEFSERNKIPIESIYTGKMFYGIYDLIKKNFFKPGATIVAIHTGGTSFIS